MARNRSEKIPSHGAEGMLAYARALECLFSGLSGSEALVNLRWIETASAPRHHMKKVLGIAIFPPLEDREQRQRLYLRYIRKTYGKD